MLRSSAYSLLLTALICLFLGPPAKAQSQAEIKEAVKTLREAGNQFLALIQDLNEEQWNFRSSILNRSIGEEAEHVALAEHDLVSKVVVPALQRPQRPDLAKKLDGKEDQIRDLMLDPDEPAERYEPKGRLKTKAEVLEFYDRAHRNTIKRLQTTPDLSLYTARHPHEDYQNLTALQWFYYVAYHNSRHCNQIQEIMKDPTFPGSSAQ